MGTSTLERRKLSRQEALGYRMASDMTRSLDEDEKGWAVVPTPGGEQATQKVRTSQLDGGVRRVAVINEPGFYHALNMRRTACMRDEEARARVEGDGTA